MNFYLHLGSHIIISDFAYFHSICIEASFFETEGAGADLRAINDVN